jgi:hypothetical protein
MFLDGWMDGSKSRLKDCLQQSKMKPDLKGEDYDCYLLCHWIVSIGWTFRSFHDNSCQFFCSFCLAGLFVSDGETLIFGNV